MNNLQLPTEYLNNMKNILGTDYNKYLKALNDNPVQGVRLNTLKADKSVLQEFDITDNIPYASNGYIMNNSKIGKHPYHIAGLVYVQEPSSMVAVCASGLELEETKDLIVLDLCASPGGKSGQIAEILAGDGVLISNEIDNKRAKVLAGNIERMGYTNVIVTNSSPQKLAETLPTMFDYIFVDAPCGGEGMFRKDPDTITEWRQERLLSNSVRQKEILAEAHKMLKPNGKLIYSTCTFAKEEDEDVIDWFITEYGYSLVMPKPSIIDSTTFLSKPECRRFYPHIASGEGQFICVMQKSDDETKYVHKQKMPKMGNSEIKLTNDFILTNFNLPFAVNYTKVGDNICLINKNLQNMLEYMQKLPIINAGITAGNIEKNRFIAHNNMFTALGKYCKNKLNFAVNSPILQKYLHGEQINNTLDIKSGYVCICVNNHSICGSRVSGNNLKNIFPKGLRI